MRLRSLLFVPGDRPERMEKALRCGADALILDLEDSVVPERKPFAREAVANFLRGGADSGAQLMVRVNPLGSADLSLDLESIEGLAPAAVVLPKAEGAQSIAEFQQNIVHRKPNEVPLLPIATETPTAVFQLGTYGQVSKSLIGLTWGAEDLPAAIGAATSREADGSYTAPYEVVRALALLAAHSAGVQAIETVYPDFRDLDGLRAYAARARRDGFTGMMAIHPTQIEAINQSFTPTKEEIAWARRIVTLFDAHPGAGALAIDGKMVDAPHLKQAKRLLAGAVVEP